MTRSAPDGSAPQPATILRLLTEVAARAARYRELVHELPVYPSAGADAAIRSWSGRLADHGADPFRVIDELATAVTPALVAQTGPRYFGFVNGGALPAATAAEVLTAAWDQNAFNAVTSPAAAAVEEVAGSWLKELLGLPATASCGFVTGGQAANLVALAAARLSVLASVGWDVNRDGLLGAPRVRVLANADRHATIDRALRLLGLGENALEPVATDEQGRIRLAALRAALAAGGGPIIVCLQAGNVNTGSFDAFEEAIELAHAHGAWVHVDGAFGLWVAASPTRRYLAAGVDAADSWAVDGHKWLQVPYDSGYVFCADAQAHRDATHHAAAYLTGQDRHLPAPGDYAVELSRRARGFATWAAIRELGRTGVAEVVDRCCERARQFAAQISTLPGSDVVNDVVINQVLVRFAGGDEATEAVVAAVQAGGEAWMGATTWRGERLMRVSVCNPLTSPDDIDRTARAVARAWQRVS